MKTQKHLTIHQQKGRLDKVLAQEFSDFSRSQLQEWIEIQKVTVNGEATLNKYKVKTGDEVVINVPEPEPIATKPEALPLDIIYEDADLAIINKPRGMVVHPGAGNPEGTLVNALLYHIKDLSGINGKLRPGIVHRLDKDTTGGLVIAKNDQAHQALAAQLEDRSMKREYLALVHGNIPHEEGVINAPIGRDPKDRKKFTVREDGKEAITHFKVIERFAKYTLVAAQLETGRTHQIRVHFKFIKHPLVGDPDYGVKDELEVSAQLLHAHKLGFIHPTSGKYVEFEAPLPVDFNLVLNLLRDAQ